MGLRSRPSISWLITYFHFELLWCMTHSLHISRKYYYVYGFSLIDHLLVCICHFPHCIFTYETWPISWPSNVSTSHTARGRRIGCLNSLDRASSGFLAKSLIFPKIILQSKDRARARAKLIELWRGTRATPTRHSRCRIWSHGLQREKRRGRKRKRR